MVREVWHRAQGVPMVIVLTTLWAAAWHAVYWQQETATATRRGAYREMEEPVSDRLFLRCAPGAAAGSTEGWEVVGRLRALLRGRRPSAGEQTPCAHEVLAIGMSGADGEGSGGGAVALVRCLGCGTAFAGREARRRLAAVWAGHVRGGCVQ